jgi:transposase InsO family protein
MRTDNGDEYTSKEFMDFYVEEGIRRELTIPYNCWHRDRPRVQCYNNTPTKS